MAGERAYNVEGTDWFVNEYGELLPPNEIAQTPAGPARNAPERARFDPSILVVFITVILGGYVLMAGIHVLIHVLEFLYLVVKFIVMSAMVTAAIVFVIYMTERYR